MELPPVALALLFAGGILRLLDWIARAIGRCSSKNQKTGIRACEVLALTRGITWYDERELHASAFVPQTRFGPAIFFPESYRESDEMEAVLVAAHEAGHSHQSRSMLRLCLEALIRGPFKKAFLVTNGSFLSMTIQHSWWSASLLAPFIASFLLVLHSEWDANRRALRLIRQKTSVVSNVMAWRFLAPFLVSYATHCLSSVALTASVLVSLDSILKLDSLFS